MSMPRFRSDTTVLTSRWVRRGGHDSQVMDKAWIIESGFINSHSTVGNANDIHLIRFQDGHQTFRYGSELQLA